MTNPDQDNQWREDQARFCEFSLPTPRDVVAWLAREYGGLNDGCIEPEVRNITESRLKWTAEVHYASVADSPRGRAVLTVHMDKDVVRHQYERLLHKHRQKLLSMEFSSAKKGADRD